MNHFDYVEWLLYKENLIAEDRQMDMEGHLYNCDECLEVFLSIINEEEIEKAASLVAKDFTQNIMDEISKNKIKTMESKKHINFAYYVAVASITIFMTMAGFFSNLVDVVPKISVGLEVNKTIESPNPIYNLSEKIVGKTSEIISSIENIEEREIRRNSNDR